MELELNEFQKQLELRVASAIRTAGLTVGSREVVPVHGLQERACVVLRVEEFPLTVYVHDENANVAVGKKDWRMENHNARSGPDEIADEVVEKLDELLVRYRAGRIPARWLRETQRGREVADGGANGDRESGDQRTRASNFARFILRAAAVGAVVALVVWISLLRGLVPDSAPAGVELGLMTACPMLWVFALAAWDHSTGKLLGPGLLSVLTLLLVASNALIYAVGGAIFLLTSAAFRRARSQWRP